MEEPFVFDSGDEQKQEAKRLLDQWIAENFGERQRWEEKQDGSWGPKE